MAQSGYRLGYYKSSSGRIREVLIHVQLLHSSKLVDERQHEIYDFLKTDLIKIIKIENPIGEQIPSNISIYLTKSPELKYDIKEGEIVRFKHSDFKEALPDVSYIAFYNTKCGALNNSTEVPNDYTGSKIYYYPNGLIKEKHYYVSGYKTHVFGHYKNEFSSLHYTWVFEQKFSQAFPTIREYVYNIQENPVAQYIIDNSKIINKVIYDKTNYIKSVYLAKSN